MYFFHNGIYIPVELNDNFPGDMFYSFYMMVRDFNLFLLIKLNYKNNEYVCTRQTYGVAEWAAE